MAAELFGLVSGGFFVAIIGYLVLSKFEDLRI